MIVELTDACAELLTYQKYGSKAPLEGVFHMPLKKHAALEGWFMEHLRLSNGLVEGLPVDFQVKQISISRAVPHRINAFHIHPKRRQDEIWCVVEGVLKVWLADLRKDSPTCGEKRSHLLTAESPSLLYIPSGVAHGYKAGHEGALLLYVMNDQFDVQDPNEGRLPWDYLGKELWEADRG